MKFTRELATDPTKEWKSVDQHHLESLREILIRRNLIMPRDSDVPESLVQDGSLWDERQLQELNFVWHQLNPWQDTCRGIQQLNRQFYTCTLSNGNLSLLEDMVKHAKMDFTHIYSAEMFQSYKPSPKVYLGAAEKMGLKPEECAMVAAHLDDLKAAKSHGFGTAIYVERPLEERRPELGKEGFVDVWVKEDEDGFVTAAERLGIDVPRL
jgi:2-haloacid dehalogenase